MYKEIRYTDLSKEMLEQLEKGGFLTVKNGDRTNTMTIAWGTLGYIWNRPVFTALVRYSRFTHELIYTAKDFTVSLPLNGQLKKELGICGSKSGRDMDKFKECGLKLQEGEKVESPVIDGCDLHIECKVVYKQEMEENNICDEIKEKSYPNGDYHVMYFGEIVKIYVRDEE